MKKHHADPKPCARWGIYDATERLVLTTSDRMPPHSGWGEFAHRVDVIPRTKKRSKAKWSPPTYPLH